MAKSVSKKRKVIIDSFGEAHINASFNNIIISLTNKKGEVIILLNEAFICASPNEYTITFLFLDTDLAIINII